MTDPAIRAALDAADQALVEHFGPPYPSPNLPLAAAAVAAFLRALPDECMESGAWFWDAIPAQEQPRLWLADAVERAAGGEG